MTRTQTLSQGGPGRQPLGGIPGLGHRAPLLIISGGQSPEQRRVTGTCPPCCLSIKAELASESTFQSPQSFLSIFHPELLVFSNSRESQPWAYSFSE